MQQPPESPHFKPTHAAYMYTETAAHQQQFMWYTSVRPHRPIGCVAGVWATYVYMQLSVFKSHCHCHVLPAASHCQGLCHHHARHQGLCHHASHQARHRRLQNSKTHPTTSKEQTTHMLDVSHVYIRMCTYGARISYAPRDIPILSNTCPVHIHTYIPHCQDHLSCCQTLQHL